MSEKFEANLESLFERLLDYTAIDDIKAITFYNTFSRKDNDSPGETNFDLILSFVHECFQIVILFLVSTHIPSSLKNRINLQRIILTRK